MMNFKKTLDLINNSNIKFDIYNSYTTKTLKNNLVKFNSQDMSKSDYHFYFKHLYQFISTFLVMIFRYFKKMSGSI